MTATRIGTVAGVTAITADCIICGLTFTAITDDHTATVHHRCPTLTCGPVWVVTEPGGRLK